MTRTGGSLLQLHEWVLAWTATALLLASGALGACKTLEGSPCLASAIIPPAFGQTHDGIDLAACVVAWGCTCCSLYRCTFSYIEQSVV